MIDDEAAAPVPALAYLPPAEAAGNPWAAVVRGIGLVAAALATARIGSAAFTAMFLWGLRQRQGPVLLDVRSMLGIGEALLYLPLLIGGIACARPRYSTWKLLSYGLIALLAVKVLILILAGMAMLFTSATSFGLVGRIGLAGQSIFHTLEDIIPLALLLWVLRRPMIRDVFRNASDEL